MYFKRNIQPLRHELPYDIIEAMYSIASAEPHHNFEATLAKIQKGGTKAKGKLFSKHIRKCTHRTSSMA